MPLIRAFIVSLADELILLKELGLGREIVAVAPGFPDAMRIARNTDLVALVAPLVSEQQTDKR
jgi:hypothetical protein